MAMPLATMMLAMVITIMSDIHTTVNLHFFLLNTRHLAIRVADGHRGRPCKAE